MAEKDPICRREIFGDGTKYLALQEQEKELLRSIQESGQFKKTIVLLNSSNALELGWMDQKEYGVDACLWIGGVGQSGARAVADVLAGKINPSGHLVDTYAADSFSSPAMQNFGDYTYSNADEIENRLVDRTVVRNMLSIVREFMLAIGIMKHDMQTV